MLFYHGTLFMLYRGKEEKKTLCSVVKGTQNADALRRRDCWTAVHGTVGQDWTPYLRDEVRVFMQVQGRRATAFLVAD